MGRRVVAGARILALLALLGVPGSGLGAGVEDRGRPPAAAEWVEIRSEPGRFAVRMPGRPESIARSQLTVAGRVRTVEYRIRRGATELRLEHHDLPRLASALITDAALLDRAAGDLVADEGGVDPRVEGVSVQGHPAREVSYRIDDPAGGAGDALLVLVGRRVYVLATRYPEAAADAAASRRFLRSFQLWDPGR